MPLSITGARHPKIAAIDGYVLNSGIMPLYRVEEVPRDFDAAKPDVPLFRAPLYRATYCRSTRLWGLYTLLPLLNSSCGATSSTQLNRHNQDHDAERVIHVQLRRKGLEESEDR